MSGDILTPEERFAQSELFAVQYHSLRGQRFTASGPVLGAVPQVEQDAAIPAPAFTASGPVLGAVPQELGV